MGLSMEFYAGDADRIGRAFSDFNFDGLRDGTIAHAYADLSLHLSPDHLDLLSDEIAKSLDRPPVLFLDSLGRKVGGNESESSAEVVSRPWVEVVAALPHEAIARLAASWMAAVAQESDDHTVESSPDVEAALRALIDVCMQALARGTSVVFGWYL